MIVLVDWKYPPAKNKTRRKVKIMKLKKWIALLLVVVMATTALAGCGKKEEEEKLDFYFIALMTGGAAWSRAEKGFNDACAELGINGQYVAPVERNNIVEMATLLDQAITNGADATIGCFVSAELFGPSLLNAQEKGIVTASVQMALSEEYVDFNIGTDQIKIGVAFANALGELSEGKEYNVIWMCGTANEMGNLQYDAFVEALKAYPNVHSLGMRFDEGSAATANQILADELTANPNLNGVVCLDSSAATIGTASFVDERGFEDSWLTIGIDASADILNYVKSGALDGTMNQDFYAMGYQSVKMAYEKIKNGTEPPFSNDTGTYLIKPADVDKYAADNGIDLG